MEFQYTLFLYDEVELTQIRMCFELYVFFVSEVSIECLSIVFRAYYPLIRWYEYEANQDCFVCQ